MPESGGVYERSAENGNRPAGPKMWQWASVAPAGGVQRGGACGSGWGPGIVGGLGACHRDRLGQYSAGKTVPSISLRAVRMMPARRTSGTDAVDVDVDRRR